MINNKSLFSKLKLCTLSAVWMCAITLISNAYAAGGGGGGSFSSPSRSAPAIDPVVKYQEGIAALQSGEFRAAEKAFKKVIGVTRKHANSQFFLGVALFKQDKFKKARRPLLKALKYDDDLVEAHGYLGVVFQKTNKLDKLEEQRQILIEKQQACGECQNKAKIQTALSQIDQQSVGVFDKSLGNFALSSDDGDQRYVEAVSFINQEDYQSALSSLKASSMVFGPHPDVLTYQGFANRKMGNYELALEFYRAALSIDKDHRGATEYLGEYYVETGQLDLARAQLDKLESICDFGCEEAEELRRWIVAAS